ncbi:hypothetical protein CARUB_v100243011mg, partial [Capsella rubella]
LGTEHGCNGVKEFFKKVYKKIDTPENWKNKSFMIVCAVSLAIDPLFLFIPEIDYQKSCIGFDETLRKTVASLRIIIDLLCWFAIFFPETSLRSKMSRRKRYFYFIIDIVSAVPIHMVLFSLPL